MKFIVSAYYEIKRNFRDIKLIAILIVFPLLLIFIMGTVGKSFLSGDDVEEAQIGYVNLDSGAIGKEFAKFASSKEIGSRVGLICFPGKSQAHDALDRGEISSYIYLHDKMTQNIENGKKEKILVCGKDNIELAENLARGFASAINATGAVIAAGGETAADIRNIQKSAVKRIYYGNNPAKPNSMDYYSVLTLLQLLVTGALTGISITSRDCSSDIHIRIHSLPAGRWILLAGRIAGSTVYMFLCSIVAIAFSKYAYGANWNGNAIIIAATMLLYCAVCIGTGMLAGLVFTKQSTGIMAVLILMVFFGIASGAIAPYFSIDAIKHATPNYHAKILLFGTMYEYPKKIMLDSALRLFCMAVFVFGASAVLLGRVNHDNI